MWPFKKKQQPIVAAEQPTAAEEVTARAEESVMANKFIGILEAIGKGADKGLKWALVYAVPVERLVGLLFPSVAPAIPEVINATALIQNAILLVEQKYAAIGKQSGTGSEKAAEVLVTTEQVVTEMLAKAGIQADTAYIQNIITAVVSILNVQRAPQAALPAAA